MYYYLVTLKSPITIAMYNTEEEPLIYKEVDLLQISESAYEILLKGINNNFVLTEYFQVGNTKTSINDFYHIDDRMLLNMNNILSVQQFEFFE